MAGAEVVQLYLHDPVAQVTRPVRALAGFARVTLPPGGACRVAFRLHADRTAFHGLSGTRIVEPGLIELAIGSSSGDLRLHGEVELTGPERRAGAGPGADHAGVGHGARGRVTKLGQIVLHQVSKTYPGGVRGADELNLEIGDGEFMVLVGPSGGGKSTALRSIAGWRRRRAAGGGPGQPVFL